MLLIPERAREFGLRVDVDLADLEPALVVGGELMTNRGDHPAGPAPGGPEVEQHRCLGLEDLGLEVLLRDLDRLHRSCSFSSLLLLYHYLVVRL